MTAINIHRKHNLSEPAIRARIEELATELSSSLSAQCHWQGDRLEFKRSGASGYIRQHPGEIEVQIKLGMMLKPLRGKIEETVSRHLDEALAAPDNGNQE